eukprot:Filipodium_phascolosomae@DN7934_c0_g1_i2.p1
MYSALIPRLSDYPTLQKALENVQASCEYENIRSTNLALAQQFGPVAWNRYLEGVRRTDAELDAEVKQLKNSVDDVNKKRKLEQVEAGNEFRTLQHDWEEYQQRNALLRKVVMEQESKLSTLQSLARQRGLTPDAKENS